MSDAPSLQFDVEQQLKDIERFTQNQQLEVKQLIQESHSHFSKDASVDSNAIYNQVSDMISGIESQLDQEMNKINQQLQTLLPNQSQ